MNVTNWLELSAAVIGQTCEDYCYARRKFNRYLNEGRNLTDIVVKNQIAILQSCFEFFFKEMAYFSINYISPTTLIKKLNEISDNEQEYKVVRFLKNTTSIKEECLC